MVSAGKSEPQMAAFVTRLLLHMGAVPGDEGAVYVRNFSGMFAGAPESAYDSMLGFLLQRPKWAHFDSAARCVADRKAGRHEVEKAAADLCSSAASRDMGLDCTLAPKACSTDEYSLGDWVFGTHYGLLTDPNPLRDCYFDGTAIFAGSKLYSANVSSECLVPSTESEATSAWGASNGGVEPGFSVLGIAESPGLVAAQTSGHGAWLGRWWMRGLFAMAILTCVGVGAYQSRKHIQKKAEKAAMRKRDWFKSKLPRGRRDSEQPTTRAAARAEEAPPAAVAPVVAVATPAAPLIAAASVTGQARAPGIIAIPQQAPYGGIGLAEPLPQYGHYAPLWRADR
uniref:Uncharacterized protein n=1 Tax=Alexandrium catenella TaxID=2925 RepID=A0A7S1RJZ0_ALECA